MAVSAVVVVRVLPLPSLSLNAMCVCEACECECATWRISSRGADATETAVTGADLI